jgi:SAM-dependent methyltransferase
MPRSEPPLEKMPGHWLLAKMGKRVLRPGGVELTRQMLAALAIDDADAVVEFAPGLGFTAQLALAKRPQSYTAIERDSAAAAKVASYLVGPQQKCILGSAEETGLPDASASVVYGEAMLSMQPLSTKVRIVAEAARLLRLGGRYGIHELCLTNEEDSNLKNEVARDLSDEIHAGVKPLTVSQWRGLLENAGFTIMAERLAPMHLLEPARVIADEGVCRALRFAWNVARTPEARHRVLAMRSAFRKHREHLAAIMLVAAKS